MRKWRPSFRASYLIPEVCGNLDSLEIIFNRILPLRKFTGQEDRLIMLGRYIGTDDKSAQVIDLIINIREEYKDRIILIRGDNEELWLKAVLGSEREYQYFIELNGFGTTQSYLNRAGVKSEASSFPHSRLKDIVPKQHLDFLQSLDYSYEDEDYFYFCTGINWQIPLKENTASTLMFDMTASKKFKDLVKRGEEIAVEKVLVGCNNWSNKKAKYPFINQNYMMLGISAPSRLLVADLESLEMCSVKKGKTRIYKMGMK